MRIGIDARLISQTGVGRYIRNLIWQIEKLDKKNEYFGPRFLLRLAGLAMHPLDAAKRMQFIKESAGIGLCNVTHCCNEVCPEKIKITDNAIIPLKERLADLIYDPLLIFMRKIFKRKANQ